MLFDEKLRRSSGWRITAVCVGAVLYGLALGLFFAPNDIAPGGVSGVAVMLATVVPVGVGSLAMMINLPLLIIAILKWGWKFLFSTVVAIILSGVSADFCAFLPAVTDNRMLAALAGGGLMGVSCGLVLRAGSTTGGTDIVSRLLRAKYPHLKLSTLLLIVDGIIALTSGIVFKSPENALYSLLAIFLSSKVLDRVLYGADSARMIFVISSKSQEILSCLLNDHEVGCTVLKGISGFEGKDMRILLCAMRKQRYPAVKNSVLEIDKKAFILVTNAGEVFGEGFKTQKDDFL